MRILKTRTYELDDDGRFPDLPFDKGEYQSATKETGLKDKQIN